MAQSVRELMSPDPKTIDDHAVGILSIGDLAVTGDPNSALADISAAPANV